MSEKILSWQRNSLVRALHIWGLFAVAIAQPLLDILGQNATFFLAHRLQSAGVILYAMVLVGIPPMLLFLSGAVVRRLSLAAGNIFHSILTGILSSTVLLYVMNQLKFFSGFLTFVVFSLFSVCFIFLYWRNDFLDRFLSFLSVTVLLIPVVFLFFTPVKGLIFSDSKIDDQHQVKNPVPVVFLVLDELPLGSLLNAEGMIDEETFPNFAALAQSSYWFKNATANATETFLAIPSLLTGRYPSENRPPSYKEYANNLFSMLRLSYDLTVLETMTQLCAPDWLPKSDSGAGFLESLDGLTLDSGLVLLHLLTPPEWRPKLPSIDDRWGHFLSGGSKRLTGKDDSQRIGEERVTLFRNFIDGLEKKGQTRPPFHFLHVLLPHVQWRFMPSGKDYGLTGETLALSARYPLLGWDPVKKEWGTNDFLLKQGLQRHLFQVAYVDKLLGEMVAKLKLAGMYDQCLLIVTSDHGAGFASGEPRRDLTRDNAPELLPVPLLVKLPGQKNGIIDERNAELVDVAPTIAELLDLQPRPDFDGKDLFAHPKDYRSQKLAWKFEDEGTLTRMVFDPQFGTRSILGGKKYSWLQKTGDGTYPFKIQSNLSEMMGKPVAEFKVLGGSNYHAVFDQEVLFKDTDNKGSFLPCHVLGKIIGSPSSGSQQDVVLAINGIIRGSGPLYSIGGEPGHFSFLVQEESFRNGRNALDLYLVEGYKVDQFQLRKVGHAPIRQYSLHAPVGYCGGVIRAPDGREYLIVGNNGGRLERVVARGDKVSVTGWAFHKKESQAPAEIVIFYGDKTLSVLLGEPQVVRPDVARFFQSPEALKTGFSFEMPSRLVGNPFNSSSIRVFALYSSGIALEVVVESMPRFEHSWTQERELSYLKESLLSKNNMTRPEINYNNQKDGKLIGRVDKTFSAGGLTYLLGWTISNENNSCVDEIYIEKEGAREFSGKTTISRPDVNAHYLLNKDFNVGFCFQVDSETYFKNSIQMFATSNGASKKLD